MPELIIYSAKGAPNSCGPGCDRWIAIEGKIDAGAAARVERFFREQKDTQRPIYFHSPRGEMRQAFDAAGGVPLSGCYKGFRSAGIDYGKNPPSVHPQISPHADR